MTTTDDRSRVAADVREAALAAAYVERHPKSETTEASSSGGQLGTFVDPYAKSDQPPVLPGMAPRSMTTEGVEALPSGTVLLWPHNGLAWQRLHPNAAEVPGRPWKPANGSKSEFPSRHLAESGELVVLWTPPPAEPEPVWSVLSTDREKPTLAKVTYQLPRVSEKYVGIGAFFRVDGEVCLADGDEGDFITGEKTITSVELLHTYNPETHVLVARAVFDHVLVELRELCGDGCATVSALAALADDSLDGEVSA